MRGEYSVHTDTRNRGLGSPPLARGILCYPFLFSRANQDHPRLRGEYIMVERPPGVDWGSPPLARGIRRGDEIVADYTGITPACAGNTFQCIPEIRHRKDHPRLRGEYLSKIMKQEVHSGSPPLARGIPAWGWTYDINDGITPACAGNTLKKSLIYNLFPISISKFHLVSQTPEMS